MNINYITLAQNLQRLMDEKGIDRNKLCEDLGLKYVTVSSWLEARKYPRIDKIEMLANYFNVSTAHLTVKWYTQFEGTPHLYDSKRSAPAVEDSKGKKIKEIMEIVETLDDSGLELLDSYLSVLVEAKRRGKAEG